MNTVILSFGYIGPKSNFCEEKSDNFLLRVEKFLIKAFLDRGLELQHEYSWPDGSLYKKVVSEKSSDEIRLIASEICESCNFADVHLLDY